MLTLNEAAVKVAQWKQTAGYTDYLKKLAEQDEWIRSHFPSIETHEDIETIRTAMNSIKHCPGCKRTKCPKKTCQYTFVGELCWYNSKAYLRWVPDCRKTRTNKVPTWQRFNEQLLKEQEQNG